MAWPAGCGGTPASDAERPEADTSRSPQAAMGAAERPVWATMATQATATMILRTHYGCYNDKDNVEGDKAARL